MAKKLYIFKDRHGTYISYYKPTFDKTDMSWDLFTIGGGSIGFRVNGVKNLKINQIKTISNQEWRNLLSLIK